MAVTKKQKKATVETNEQAGTLTFRFAAGGDFVASLADINPDITRRLTLHGLKQKLADSYAGDVESPEFEVRDLYGELARGQWSTRAPGEPRITLLAEAIATLRPKDGVKHEDRVQQAMSWLQDATEEQRAVLRKDLQVKAAIASIQDKRAKAAAKAAPKLSLDF